VLILGGFCGGMDTIDFLIGLVLVLVMFGIGISLTMHEVRNVFARPKALFISLSAQMIVLPLIAFGMCLLFDIPLYIKLGLIILAASPGGTTAGFITFLFRGNTALSIVLTTVNSLLTLVSIPLIVNFSLLYFYGHTEEFSLPIFTTMREIFVLTAIPAFSGILVRHWKEKFALTISRYTKPVSTILLGIVFTLKFLSGHDQGGVSQREIFEILPYALLLNVLCFLSGYFITVFFRLGRRNQITVSVESAVHNTTIAFLVSGTLLHRPELGKVSLVYAMFSFWTAILFCFMLIKSSRIRLFKRKVENRDRNRGMKQ